MAIKKKKKKSLVELSYGNGSRKFFMEGIQVNEK